MHRLNNAAGIDPDRRVINAQFPLYLQVLIQARANQFPSVSVPVGSLLPVMSAAVA